MTPSCLVFSTVAGFRWIPVDLVQEVVRETNSLLDQIVHDGKVYPATDLRNGIDDSNRSILLKDGTALVVNMVQALSADCKCPQYQFGVRP